LYIVSFQFLPIFAAQLIGMADTRYNLRGVSAGKEDVHNAIKNVDKGLFPQAFCKIVPDYLSGDENYCRYAC